MEKKLIECIASKIYVKLTKGRLNEFMPIHFNHFLDRLIVVNIDILTNTYNEYTIKLMIVLYLQIIIKIKNIFKNTIIKWRCLL